MWNAGLKFVSDNFIARCFYQSDLYLIFLTFIKLYLQTLVLLYDAVEATLHRVKGFEFIRTFHIQCYISLLRYLMITKLSWRLEISTRVRLPMIPEFYWGVWWKHILSLIHNRIYHGSYVGLSHNWIIRLKVHLWNYRLLHLMRYVWNVCWRLFV